MCQAKVFVVRDGQRELVAQDVVSIEEGDDGVSLNTFFDEPVLVRGRIAGIDFLKHTVTILPTTSTVGAAPVAAQPTPEANSDAQ